MKYQMLKESQSRVNIGGRGVSVVGLKITLNLMIFGGCYVRLKSQRYLNTSQWVNKVYFISKAPNPAFDLSWRYN